MRTTKNKFILITGPSSGGKTSVSDALLGSLYGPWRGLSVDQFIDKLPEHLRHNTDYTDQAFRDTLAAAVEFRKSSSVICEGVFSQAFIPAIKRHFGFCNMESVLLTAYPQDLRKRENLRVGRNGEWLDQHKCFLDSRPYNVAINTSILRTEEAACVIKQRLHLK